MSPILGVGLSLAIHDKQLLIRSLKDLFVAVVISLAASVLYFSLSPLGEPTTELQARTFPTLLDVLIALFGGVAGTVSISRRFQTNAIPGVAIATALMPPLCTAGFGLATLHWGYFFGALYLFFINAVFISLSTYLIVKYLHFPETHYLDKKLDKKYSVIFTFISIIIILPSIYFLYSVYQKETAKKKINEIVIHPIEKQQNEILKWETEQRDTLTLIKVYYSGTPLTDSLKKDIDSNLNRLGLGLYRLKAMRVNLTKEEVNKLSAEAAQQMFDELHLEELKDLDHLQIETTDTIAYQQIAKEATIAFSFLDTLRAGTLISYLPKNQKDALPIFFFRAHRILNINQKNQLYRYLLLRTGKDTVALVPL